MLGEKVDLSVLPKLQNVDYFRERAIYFKEHGCYTKLVPNKHPDSDYIKFWREEERRCLQGYMREDGIWITGYHYFYLNYSPIWLTVPSEGHEQKAGGRRKADRVYTFPRFWDSDYQYFHYIEQAEDAGMHGITLKTRGRGYSFKGGAMLARNFYLVPGSKSYAVAEEKEYLTKDGLLTKAWDVLDWIDNHTPWKKVREKVNLPMHKKASYLEGDIEKGIKSEIIGISLKNDPDKAIGKRGKLMLWEESGKNRYLLEAWQKARPSFEQGEDVFGFMIAFGTGGTVGANFEGMEEMFYNPDGYNIYGVSNIWDDGRVNSKCGFFVPEYMNREGCYDENGNSDIDKAQMEVEKEREKVKKTSSDPTTFTLFKSQLPFNPQEAIIKTEGTIFPVEDLKAHLAEVETHPIKYTEPNWKTSLVVNSNGQVEWKYSNDEPIRMFPLKETKNVKGCIEIFEQPVKNSEGNIPFGVYIAATDPYDDDGTVGSLGSTFVMNTLTGRLVAEYTGRPNTAEEYYENVLRLCKYYNAVNNYENNKKGMFSYFDQKNSLYLLADTPKILADMELAKINTSGNKAHPYSQKVITPNGVKLWRDIKIGDFLYSSYNTITKVIDIPFDEETYIYEISLKDGRKVLASENHLWKIINTNNKEKILTTKEMSKNLFRQKGNYKEYKYYIPKNEGIEYEYKNVKIEPYLLGILLGDGSLCSSKHHNFGFTSSINDFEKYKEILKFESITVDDRHHYIRFKDAGKILKELNLHDKKSRTKFIPDTYKYNSKKVRLELLKGLLDTDGSVGYGGNPEYVSTSKALAEDVLEIGRSLGINCNMNVGTNEFGFWYKIRFYTDIKLFNLERKYSKQKITKKRAFKTAIVDIKFSHVEKAKCVTVDSKDSCYLIGDFITTHNSKGTNAVKEVNAYARRLIKTWLVSQAYGKEEGICNLHTIKSPALLRELISWNIDGNFDRVSALGMLMLLKEDRVKIVASIENNTKSLAIDSFFVRNRGGRNQMAIAHQKNIIETIKL